MLSGSRFDLLLADLALPGMDGIALLREARQIDPHLVGIIMTGEGTITTAVEAMRSGAYDYILKPFRIGAILPVLQRGTAVRRLREDNDRLERDLRERAAELEATNQELDAFTRSASHDLRSPLAGVQGLVALALSQFAGELPPQLAQWLAQIEAETRRMMQLTDDLLRLSRLGRQAVEPTRVNVREIVDGVVEELRRREPERQVQVLIGSLPDAWADAGLVRQVFVNLLSNAFKFTRGSPQPTVEIGARLQDGQQIYSVRDNGAGFDPARADKLFMPFHRLHRPGDFEGSGVGLTIVQRIVQRHGGRVWARSEPGQGATFEFTLETPLVDQAR
jgi:signal transduction histidine kinase